MSDRYLKVENANVTWPVSFKKDTDQLERVQRRATRLLPKMRQLQYLDRLKLLNHLKSCLQKA